MVYKELASLITGTGAAAGAYYYAAANACEYVPEIPNACTSDMQIACLVPLAFLVGSGLTYLGLTGRLGNLLPNNTSKPRD